MAGSKKRTLSAAIAVALLTILAVIAMTGRPAPAQDNADAERERLIGRARQSAEIQRFIGDKEVRLRLRQAEQTMPPGKLVAVREIAGDLFLTLDTGRSTFLVRYNDIQAIEQMK
jgi:hypothetical protein